MKPLTTFRIAHSNLSGKPGRAAALIIVVAIMAFALFGGAILLRSLDNGMESLESRLGADIIVLPPGNEAVFESTVLTGTPATFYFDRVWINELARSWGIEQVTTQFYIATLADAECCTTDVQIIGIDYETDFVVTPWISELINRQISDGEVIVGSNIILDSDNTVTFFDANFEVAARLSRTATGMDNTVFVNMDTAMQLGHIAQAGGFIPADVDIENSVSVILLNMTPGHDLSGVIANLQRHFPTFGIMASNAIAYTISLTLNFITGLITAVMIMLGVFALLVLAMLFSLIANSRKKEFAVLRIVGATRSKLAAVVLTEAVIISAVGAVVGCLLAAIVVFPFGRVIGVQMEMPLLLPGILTSALILVLAMAISTAIGPLSSAYSAYKISRAETYATMRDGE